jgi:hypothetical protein
MLVLCRKEIPARWFLPHPARRTRANRRASGSAVEMVGGGMLPGMRRPWAHGPASSMSSRRRYSYMTTSGRGLRAMTPFGV